MLAGFWIAQTSVLGWFDLWKVWRQAKVQKHWGPKVSSDGQKKVSNLKY